MGAVDSILEQYRSAIRSILTEIASYRGPENGAEHTLFDRESDRYAIISQGWKKDRLLHNVVILLEIIDAKIWIQADHTDLVVARQLETAGIPKSDIVLGFQPPRLRPHTEYAVA